MGVAYKVVTVVAAVGAVLVLGFYLLVKLGYLGDVGAIIGATVGLVLGAVFVLGVVMAFFNPEKCAAVRRWTNVFLHGLSWNWRQFRLRRREDARMSENDEGAEREALDSEREALKAEWEALEAERRALKESRRALKESRRALHARYAMHISRFEAWDARRQAMEAADPE